MNRIYIPDDPTDPWVGSSTQQGPRGQAHRQNLGNESRDGRELFSHPIHNGQVTRRDEECVSSEDRNREPNPGYTLSQLAPHSGVVDRGRVSAVDPTPTGFEALQQAMEHSPSPPPSPPPGRSSSQTTSVMNKAFSFFAGILPFKAKLSREWPVARYSVIQRMSELGVRWSEPHGRGSMYCEYGQKSTPDYVAFAIRWVTNGAKGPPFPGVEMWLTEITIEKDCGSGSKFREVGGEIMDAVKYEIRGGVQLDYYVKTWGLY